MPKRTIQVGARRFESYREAHDVFADILHNYSPGSRVSDAHGELLMALLERHDDRDDKIGVGIDHFEVSNAPFNLPNLCFWIVRTNGTRIDFSFPHCLKVKACDLALAQG